MFERAAYKCRAYPDPEHASVLNRTFGCVRVVWNRTLAWRHQRCRAEKAGTSFTQANAYLTAMKATGELAWLNEVSSVPLQQAIRHQQAAYTAFFAKRARYPRFKSRQGRQSAEYTRSGFRYRGGRLHLAKMDTRLAFVWSWPDVDPATIDPTMVTVSRDPCGRWYVCFAVDVPGPDPFPACGWATFRAMTEYKAARYGRRVIVIGRWYPSSRTCSACGHLLAELSLGTRAWQCPSCGTRYDRDHNAAKNILAAGLAVAGDNPGHACGADVRPQGNPLRRSAVKQEPQGVSPGIPVLQAGE
jgi:transposase